MRTIKYIVAVCLLACISIIGFSACEKYGKGTPPAIKKLIRENYPLGYVTEYECEKSLYYSLCNPIGTSDGSCLFYDEYGNFICSVGGLDGKNNCGDFFDKAIKKRIIWTDEKRIKRISKKNKRKNS